MARSDSDPQTGPVRLRRSALFVPASNERAIDKARSLPCDVIILDLEDAVAVSMKDTARARAIAAIDSGVFGDREVVVRVNAFDTPWGAADIAAVSAASVDGILLPKINGPRCLERYAQSLTAAAQPSLWAMIETTRCLFELGQIAAIAAHVRLRVLVLGANDLAKELHAKITPARSALLTAMGLSVAAARAHGLDVLDAVFNDIHDELGFTEQCHQGREFGFDGKTLIHPNQIQLCNEAFSPSDAELAWARSISAAFELAQNQDKAAINVDGRMVERLHLQEAQRILTVLRTIESRAAHRS